jgi:hypothetical protein
MRYKDGLQKIFGVCYYQLGELVYVLLMMLRIVSVKQE